MRVTGFILFVCLSLVACNHDFPSSSKGDGPPEDDARAEASAPDPDGWAPRDLTMPDGCPSTRPDGSPPTDCARIDTWTCLPQCGDYARLACFAGQALQREIRCNSGGDCACIATPGAAPQPCLGLPIPSRTGCDRCKAAFIYGCCN